MNRINRILKSILFRILPIYYQLGGGNNRLKGVGLLWGLRRIFIAGKGNTVECYGKFGKNVKIIIYGNNHRLIIKNGVIFKSGSIWFEDNNCSICIENGTTIEEAHLAVAENNTSIAIGEDCMLSEGIKMSTTDSHSVIDCVTGKRTNPPANIVIDKHVWVGGRVVINKGSIIGEGSIIGNNSVVNSKYKIPPCSIAAGIPAKVVKSNVTWNRKRLKY